MHKLIDKRFSGNLRAISILLTRYAAAVPDDVARSPETAGAQRDMDEHDHAILDALRASLRDGKE